MIRDQFWVNLASMSSRICMQKLTHTADNSIFKRKYVYQQTYFFFTLPDIYFEKCRKSAFECLRTDQCIIDHQVHHKKWNNRNNQLQFLLIWKSDLLHKKNMSLKLWNTTTLWNLFECSFFQISMPLNKHSLECTRKSKASQPSRMTAYDRSLGVATTDDITTSKVPCFLWLYKGLKTFLTLQFWR